MPLLNYKACFEKPVAELIKCQTIRARRKDGRDPKPGDTLYHYVGARTKNCRRILVSQCKSTHPVKIFEEGGIECVTIDGRLLGTNQVRRLAALDGFAVQQEFIDFFRQNHGLPFDGLLIKW